MVSPLLVDKKKVYCPSIENMERKVSLTGGFIAEKGRSKHS